MLSRAPSMPRPWLVGVRDPKATTVHLVNELADVADERATIAIMTNFPCHNHCLSAMGCGVEKQAKPALDEPFAVTYPGGGRRPQPSVLVSSRAAW